MSPNVEQFCNGIFDKLYTKRLQLFLESRNVVACGTRSCLILQRLQPQQTAESSSEILVHVAVDNRVYPNTNLEQNKGERFLHHKGTKNIMALGKCCVYL